MLRNINPAVKISQWALALNKRPVAFFLIGLFFALSVYSWWFTRAYFSERAAIEMKARAEKIEATIQNRITIYQDALDYILGTLRVVNNMDMNRFDQFMNDIKIYDKYSGFQSAGIAKVVSEKQKEQHEVFFRSELGDKEYKIFPEKNNSIQVPIVLAEPVNWRNKRSLGFDLYQDPSLKLAMDLAVSQNSATLSHPTYLIQETDAKKQLGFMILAPNFESNSGLSTKSPIENVKEFAFISLRSQDFFESIFNSAIKDDLKFNFIVYARDKDNQIYTLYEKLPESKSEVSDVTLAQIKLLNQIWEIKFFHFKHGLFFWKHWIPLSVGTCTFVFLLFILFTVYSTQSYMEEQERLARSLEAAERQARAASRAKNAFLANMSHEIRTPLGAMIGFSELLATKKLSDSDQKNAFESIHRNGQLLVRLIDDILDLAKIEAEKLVIKKSTLNLNSLLFETKSLMQVRATEKKLDLIFTNSTPFPEFIVSDEVRIKQVLFNLIGNAIKFTKEGSIHCGIEFTPSPQNPVYWGILCFFIQDTGIGISDEAQKEVFQPFSQGDIAYTRAYGGSGLGLTLSKRISESLKGDVELVSSTVGKGSVFKFWLPIEADPKKGKQLISKFTEAVESKTTDEFLPEQNLKNTLKGAKIVLAEDSLDNQEIFQLFLESAGAQISLCNNGVEVVSLIENSQPHPDFDLILMDIQMPFMDGKEATRRLRQLGFKGPIVALTAHVTPEERQSCLEAGCNGQITKPLTYDKFIEGVKYYLKGEVS